MAATAPTEEGEDNPLDFLDRLLDDERDSSLHFGDVRFWKHLEYMDKHQIYRTKSIEYRTLKMMLCETIFYALFLFFLTGFIIQWRSGSLYDSRRQQLNYWAGCKVSTLERRSCAVDDVKDAKTLMTWLRDELAPKAFTTRDLYPGIVGSRSIFRLQDGTVPWSPRYVGDTKTSTLVGAVRLRQLRVKYNKGCEILEDLESIHPDCFPKFSTDDQSTISWAPAGTPGHLNEHYVWHSANISEQEPIAGFHGVYPGDGFFFDLPLNLTGARARFEELEEWKWIDERTRAFSVELSTLNPNVNIFVHTRFLFEFPAIGGVVAKQEVFAFRALQLSLALMRTDDLAGVFIFGICTCSLHLLLLCHVGYLVYKNGLRFFTYFWSICDLVILFLFVTQVIINVIIFAQVGSKPNMQPEVIADPEMWFPIGSIVPNLRLSSSFLAALGVMAWLKILKYFSLIAAFESFVRIIERCVQNLILFAGLLIVVLTGFGLALYIAYGGEADLFSTIRGSLLAVMVAPAGGVDFTQVFKKDDFIGPVLILAYIILVGLLLINTFMAICVDVYSVCTYQISEVYRKNHGSPMGTFLWTYFNALKGVRLSGKEKDEDIGKDDEQRIVLTSLPEAVATRYLETKQRMEALLNSAESEMDAQKMEKLRQAGVITDTTDTFASSAGLRSRLDRTGDSKLALENQQQQQALALQDKQSFDSGISPDQLRTQSSLASNQPEDTNGVFVNRVQLQRMLEDDEMLREICGTGRAVDVVRRFRVDQSGDDPFETVAQLQAAVTRKLQEIEDHGMDIHFDEMETLKTVSQELHSALTESQKEWRAELLTVLQMASLLSNALIDLTRKLEQVQLNHNNLAVTAGNSGK